MPRSGKTLSEDPPAGSADTSAQYTRDRDLVELIRKVVREVFQEETAKISVQLSEVSTQLKIINDKYNSIEAAISDLSAKMDKTLNVFLPSIVKKSFDLTAALTEKHLDKEVHSRKWSVIVQGLPGDAGESESVTRQKCINLAVNHLGLTESSSLDFAACHRLSNQSGAAIIARFVDLDKRNQWLSNAKKLASYPGRVSISPDLPPILRDVKLQLLKKRSELNPEMKKASFVRHLKSFPYVQLDIRGRPPIRPDITLHDLAAKYLNVSPTVNFSV